MARFNPYRPNDIIHPSMFAGRYNELVALEKALFQTKNGNPSHFIVDGERGIGKSSLLLNVTAVAKGEVPDLEESQSFNFVTVSVCVDERFGYGDVVRSIASELRRQISAREHIKELARGAWEFLKKWEIGGVRFNDAGQGETKDTELVEELSFALAESLKNLGSTTDGVLILIDEADKPPASANLGAFVKLLTERLKLRGCDKVCIGLAGLTTLRDRLRKSHESSLRLFNIFALQPLSTSDCVKVIRKGLEEANAKNPIPVVIDPDAEQSLAFITEGYPHFIQQFCYCAFDADSDNRIDTEDVRLGAYGENGALRQLGLKYFEKQYFDQIGSDEYRQVLRVMAEHFDSWVTKAEIRKEAPGLKSSTLDNALSALKGRGIILSRPGTKGVYKLPSRSFAVWIRAYTRADELINSAVAGTSGTTPSQNRNRDE